MTRRTGFMYSVFAVFMLTLVLLTVSNPVSVQEINEQTDVSHVDETYYYLSSLESDLSRTGRITAKRAFSATVNHVGDTGNGANNGHMAVQSAFRNGTINGTEQVLMEDTSYADWRASMIQQAQNAGWQLELNLTGLNTVAQSPVQAIINATYNLTLHHPTAETSFQRQVNRQHNTSLANVTDPLLLLQTNGQYGRGFAACDTDTHTNDLGDGTEYVYRNTPENANWTSGSAAVRPGNGGISGISGQSDKIVVVEDVCAYSNSTLQNEMDDFAGVVSEQSAGLSGDGDRVCGDRDSSTLKAYIGGVSGITGNVSNGTMLVLLNATAWSNRIPDQIDNACYFSSDVGPGFFERVEGILVSNGGSYGWGSFVDVAELPSGYQDTSRSAVDYVYFNDSSYGDNHKVMGVTDHYSWFKLDQAHLDRWNMNDLAYE